MLGLIPSENIPRIYFLCYIIKACVIAVGDNGMALCFKGIQVIHDLAAEEGAAVLKCGFIDDDLRTLSFYSFHHALDA